MRIHAGHDDLGVEVWHGDCMDVLAKMEDESVDAFVCDPPYNLAFMGREWDTHVGPVAYQEWCRAWATEALRVLKPGGHLLAFGGTRTHHRLMSGVEDAGFEIRDSITWLYGSGFPKSLDVSKAIDRAAGVDREVVDTVPARLPQAQAAGWGNRGRDAHRDAHRGTVPMPITAPATDDAKKWAGYGTALKPAGEPVVCARKPLSEKTVAANVIRHGTGAINVDACRVAAMPGDYTHLGNDLGKRDDETDWRFQKRQVEPHAVGRWPANVVLSHAATAEGDDACADGCVEGCAVAELDRQSGTSTSPPVGSFVRQKPRESGSMAGGMSHDADKPNGYGDSGGSSRFFPVFRYQAKAPKSQRPKVDGVTHATVKPLTLMQWLVRLVTPPGGIVCDPFAGSGTTVEACINEGFRCIAAEAEAEYLPLIDVRIARSRPSLWISSACSRHRRSRPSSRWRGSPPRRTAGRGCRGGQSNVTTASTY